MSSPKVDWVCLQCNHTWKGKPKEDRKTEPRCPQCGVRTVVLGDRPPPIESPTEPGELIPEEDLHDLMTHPIEVDHQLIFGTVDVPPGQKKIPLEKKYTRAQLARMEKASKQAMMSLVSMGYTGGLMVANWAFNWSLPPPTQDEVEQFSTAWLNVTKSQKTFHKTMERIPWFGLFALHFWFFFQRRRFFKPPYQEETTILKETDPEPTPEVIEIPGKSPFSDAFKETKGEHEE